MKKTTFLTAGFLAAATLSVGAFSPALAAPADLAAGFGGFGLGWKPAQLEALGSEGGFIGDKFYTDFVFTGAPSAGSWTFTHAGANHTLGASGLSFSGSFSYSYRVALDGTLPGQQFVSYRTQVGSSQITPSPVINKTLSTVSPGIVTGPSTSTGGFGNIVALGTAADVYFTSTVSTTVGTIDTLSDSLTQKFGDTSTVPGPLPLLGAGAAFGFSRRLRKRIKLA
jgi:hypothetical protein